MEKLAFWKAETFLRIWLLPVNLNGMWIYMGVKLTSPFSENAGVCIWYIIWIVWHAFRAFVSKFLLKTDLILPMLSQCWEWEKSNVPCVLSTMGSYGSKSGTVQAAHLTQWHPSPSHFSPLCHFFLHKHSLCHCLGATNDVTCLYLHFCFSNTEYAPHLLLSFEKHISPPCTVYDANLQAFFNYKRVCDDLSRDSCL